MLQSRYWNAFFVVSVILSLVLFLAMTFLVHSLRTKAWFYNLFAENDVLDDGNKYPVAAEMFGVIYHVLRSPGMWLTTVLIVVVSLVPDLAIFAVRKSSKAFGRKMQKFRKSYRSKLPPPPNSNNLLRPISQDYEMYRSTTPANANNNNGGFSNPAFEGSVQRLDV